MRPHGLQTKIFLDSGDPADTSHATAILGFLDGQTTNPSLITKNPAAQERLSRGEKFSQQEILHFYRNIVQEIRIILPEGSISIEVSADQNTPSGEIIAQAHEMNTWITGAHIKIPLTHEGLIAAQILVSEGINVNVTLNFSQSQAAAVHAATRGAKKGQVFISPFDGRLDDSGVQGDDVFAHIVRMYREQDSHVEVLGASIRNHLSFLYAIKLGVHNITAPLKVLEEWSRNSKPLPLEDMADLDEMHGLAAVPYEQHDLSAEWTTFDIQHDLTDAGIQKFNDDWKSIIA